MAPLKLKGDRAEIEVARDLIRRGFRVAIPYGEDWDFDLIFARPGSERLERVQVKHAIAHDGVDRGSCHSASLTNGKVRRSSATRLRRSTGSRRSTRSPTAAYYVSADELGSGPQRVSLRLTPPAEQPAQRHPLRGRYQDPEPQTGSWRWSQRGSNPRPSELQTALSQLSYGPRGPIVGALPQTGKEFSVPSGGSGSTITASFCSCQRQTMPPSGCGGSHRAARSRPPRAACASPPPSLAARSFHSQPSPAARTSGPHDVSSSTQ